MLSKQEIVTKLKTLSAGDYLYIAKEGTSGMVNHYVAARTFSSLMKDSSVLKELRHGGNLMVLFPCILCGKIDIYPLLGAYVYYYAKYFETLKAMSKYKIDNKLESKDMGDTFFHHELRDYKAKATTLEHSIKDMGLWEEAVDFRGLLLHTAKERGISAVELLPNFPNRYVHTSIESHE